PWRSVSPGAGRGTQGARKAFSPLPERSVRTREFSDHFPIVPIRSRTGRSVRVQQDVLARVRIAEGEDRRRDGASAGTVDAQADASRSRGVRAQGPLERPDHSLGIEGDLGEDPLDELHLRIGRDVPALVRQDIQALVPSGHRELAVVPEEADLLLRCDEEVPEVVLMLTHFSLEEHVDASHVRLPQRVQHQLPARTGRGGRASAPVRQGHDEARPARADPRPAGLAVPRGDDDRRAFDHGRRGRGSARGFVPVHADDEVVARDRLPDPDVGAVYRVCATRGTSGRPPFGADSMASSYARALASCRPRSLAVEARSLIASAVSKKYFAAGRWSPSARKNSAAKRPSWVSPSAP